MWGLLGVTGQSHEQMVIHGLYQMVRQFVLEDGNLAEFVMQYEGQDVTGYFEG